MSTHDDKMEKIVSLCKRRGFVFQGSEIYGGLKGTWDLGPLGVALNNRIKSEWWKLFVDGREDMYGLDAAILMNEKVWEASGHTGAGFSDPIVICQNCNTRYRADHLIEDEKKLQEIQSEIQSQFKEFFQSLSSLDSFIGYNEDMQLGIYGGYIEKTSYDIAEQNNFKLFFSKMMVDLFRDLDVDFDLIIENQVHPTHNFEQVLNKFLSDFSHFHQPAVYHYLRHLVTCKTKNCGKKAWTAPKDFNLMFETQVGAQGDIKSYLRPETAQGIFVNFKNVVDSMSPKIPFGIAQIGKAFRNEIAPREFLFRVREFEQMEIEYFVNESEWEAEFEKLRQDIIAWHNHLGLSPDNIREYEVPENDLAHYSKRTIDFEYNYPGKGFDELAGFAYRTDHDLKSHEEASGTKMRYVPAEGAPFIPHVLEPSFGVGRAFTAVLCEAYTEDEMNGEIRTYLKLPSHLAPYRVAVSPLLKNKPELVAKAREVFMMLKKEFGNVIWDDNSNVGKRYRRQDEIGTPYCVVIDFETLGQDAPELLDTVTIRHRDTGEQERVAITELITKLQ